MTRDEISEKSYDFQRETGCSEQERKSFFDGFLEAHDWFMRPPKFSLADLLAVREVFYERLELLRSDRDMYRGRDMDRYVEKDLKYHDDPYYDKYERVEKMIFELIEKI